MQTQQSQPTTKATAPELVSLPNQNDLSSHQVIKADFRRLVYEMLNEDKRFVGMSRYVLGIKMYWSTAIPTACAGHGFIFFNPNFWMKIPEETRKTVTAHEIWHLILKHLDRGLGLDQESFGIACDHAINLGLEAESFTFDGTNPYCDPKFTGMSAEEIYPYVHKQRKQSAASGQKPISGNYTAGNGDPSAPKMDPVDKSQIEDLVKEALKDEGKNKTLDEQADENAKAVDKARQGCGSDAGNSDRLLRTDGKLIHIQQATYEEIFEDYLTDPLSGGKRTYMRPSRCQSNFPMRMKGRLAKRGRSNRLMHLAYCLDVSGSISSHQANQFLKSARTIKKKLNPTLMTIMLWDTRIVWEKIFREDENLDNIRVRAGGGTSLYPVYKRLEQINPEAAIIFTDLDVQIPPQPTWETIWFVPTMINPMYTSKVGYGQIYLIPED